MNSNNYFDNYSFFSTLQNQYDSLKDVKFDNNILYYLEFSLDISNFDLKKIPLKAFMLYPYDLLNIIKINMDIEAEINYLEKNEYNLNYLYMKIRTILVKNVLSGQDEYDLSKFIEAYIALRKYQDYLTPVSSEKFHIMSSLIRDTCFMDDLSTPGISYIKEKLNEDSGRSSSNNMSLKLSNPKYKGSNDDDNLYEFSKAGFISILSVLLYLIANIGFVIATLLIKK